VAGGLRESRYFFSSFFSFAGMLGELALPDAALPDVALPVVPEAEGVDGLGDVLDCGGVAEGDLLAG
jgi:hypothetical protein